MNNNWIYPAPRKGFWGALDQLTGPGATPAELALQFIPPLLAAIAVPAYAIAHQLPWSFLQLAIAALLALDLVGGILTNATSSAKRWYHRPGQGFLQHFGFVAIHGLHVFVVAWLFRSWDWLFFLSVYGYLLIAAALTLKSPLYLQRPIACLLYILGLLVHLYVFAPAVGLEWFLPFFWMKLLISHLLKEEPYRPLNA